LTEEIPTPKVRKRGTPSIKAKKLAGIEKGAFSRKRIARSLVAGELAAYESMSANETV
jgi:hypothetical protein